jgi:hypothetical protein
MYNPEAGQKAVHPFCEGMAARRNVTINTVGARKLQPSPEERPWEGSC